MNITTATGHIYEIATLCAFLFILGVPTFFEARRKSAAAKNVAPRPTGATKY